jgi:hypothetical protein
MIVFFYKKKIFSSSEIVVVQDLELQGSLPHAVTLPVSQTLPGKQIQVDIVSSPSTEIAIEIVNEIGEAKKTSNYHESSSSTNARVRN